MTKNEDTRPLPRDVMVLLIEILRRGRITENERADLQEFLSPDGNPLRIIVCEAKEEIKRLEELGRIDEIKEQEIKARLKDIARELGYNLVKVH